MNKGAAFWTGLLLAGVALLSGCKPPKYVPYTGIRRDFRCSAPWGWQVMTDEEGTHYANTAFIGPFAPEFYLGAPSVSVRWYSYSYPHRLPDGLLETYSSVDDYVRQTLDNVYGPHPIMRQALREIELPAAGRRAKNFVVLSPAPVRPQTRWGAVIDVKTNKPVNLRQHAYVILPMKRGFYVIIYPATRDGFKLYEPEFDAVVNSFEPLLEGPEGPRAVSATSFAAKIFK